MSLILDALRKSERTRQQSLTGQLGAGEAPPPPARLALPWTSLIGILLLVNAVALAVLFWRGSNDKSAAPTPAIAPLPQATTPYRPDVRPLADEAGGAPTEAAPRPSPKTAASPTNRAIVIAPVPQPGAQTASPAQSNAAQPGASAPPQNFGTLPTLDELPTDVRQSLPTLHLDVLGYAPDPKQRFVVINLQRYAVGDSLPEGTRVLDITPQGAVLEFHATRFLLTP